MARPQRKVPWIGWRNGRAYAFWYDAEAGETKRVSLHTTDSEEAQTAFAAFLTEGIAKPRRDAGLTVEQALNDYWREHVVLRCADPVRQEDAIHHLKSFFGDCQLRAVTIPMSRAYAEHRRLNQRRRIVGRDAPPAKPEGKVGPQATKPVLRYRLTPVADSTIRRELTVLAAASNHAKLWKRTTEGASIDLPPEKHLGQDDEAPYYTRDEIEMMLMAADGELGYFITLAYYTGARRRSIEDLTLPQVRWSQGQIVLKAVGKRSTKKRQPIVPIFPEMETALGVLCDGATTRGGRLFQRAEFYRPFQALCAGLGLGGRDHPHLLRHTRATHLLQAGAPIYDVAKLLGDTIMTVDRVYGHHSQHRLAESLAGK